MKNKFELPEAIVILFGDEDIITESGPQDPYGNQGQEWWGPQNP